MKLLLLVVVSPHAECSLAANFNFQQTSNGNYIVNRNTNCYRAGSNFQAFDCANRKNHGPGREPTTVSSKYFLFSRWLLKFGVSNNS